MKRNEESKLLSFASAMACLSPHRDQEQISRIYMAMYSSPEPSSTELQDELDALREFMRHPRAFHALKNGIENNFVSSAKGKK
jgi:hypothetical protein